LVNIGKVLGAGIKDTLQLLLWQFSKPILIANLIAWPIAWYFMSDWLTGFQHHIAMNPFLFLGVGIFALLIAWATVISPTTKVARTNPLKPLGMNKPFRV
jgi:putative ABC transport system permease protein